MLEDKIRATDWEATNEAIEEQIARESYLEWLHENELRLRKKKHSATSTQTKFNDDESPNVSSPKGFSPRSTAKSPSIDRDIQSPKRYDGQSSKSNCASHSRSMEKQKDFVQSPPRATLGNVVKMSEYSCSAITHSITWHYLEPSLYDCDEDDEDVLARVLAQSQAEYLESLKSANAASKSAATSTNGTTSETATTLGDYISTLPSTSNYRS